MMKRLQPRTKNRRGAILVSFAFLLVILLGFIAFGMEVGYMSLGRAPLRHATDAASLDAAVQIGNGTT